MPGVIQCPEAPHTHSVAEVCNFIGCASEDWFLDRVRAGTFPSRRVVRELRFTHEDMNAILDACTNAAPRTATALPVPTARSRRSA
jgi:hypothetical protein